MGGFAGHMMHPYDNDNNTLQDLINIVKKFEKNKKTTLTEKLDGLNIFVSFKDNKLTMARNKSDIRSGGFSYDDIMIRWKDNPNVLFAYQFAYIKLSDMLLLRNNNEMIHNIFNKENYQIWINCEVIHHKAVNVIHYKNDFISIHNVCAYDNNANEVEIPSIEKNEALNLYNPKYTYGNYVKFTKDVSNVKLSIINNGIIDSTISLLKSSFKCYGLTNSKSTIKDYKIAAFKQYCSITSEFNLNKLIYTSNETLNNIIINRLLFNDTSINLRSIKNIIKNDDRIDDSLIESLTSIKCADLTKIKNYIMSPLIDIFRTFGFNILKNCEHYVNYYDTDKIVPELISKYALIDFYDKYNVLPLALEGVVFNYKNNTYKLTGYFPLFNDYLRQYK